MTENLFCSEFIRACEERDIQALKELSRQPLFINWLEAATLPGHSADDETYSYTAKTKLDKVVGTRISFLEYLAEPTDERIESYCEVFPEISQAIIVGNKKYWVNTVIGQGASTIIFTDSYFETRVRNHA